MMRSKAYYDIMSSTVDKWEFVGEDKHLDEKLRDYIIDYKDFMERLKNKDDDSEKNQYIHLKDATIFVSNIQQVVPIWRGKLSSVDGFCLADISDPTKWNQEK
jgi:hypothetical protein